MAEVAHGRRAREHRDHARLMTTIRPGATIGILGGGQLGRMTAMAARTLGYNVHILDPDANCAAGAVADRVVAVEIEQISPAAMDAVARHAPLRPSKAIVEVIQDRARQKRWLSDNGLPLGAYREVNTADDLAAAFDALGPLFVKARHGGYDGRSQARVQERTDVPAAWEALAGRGAVAEQALD